MKKTLIALILVVACAGSSFAGVSFLIAPSVGAGKVAVLGMYATNHNAEKTGNLSKDDALGAGGYCAQALDTTSLGIRAEYGIPMVEDLDVLAAYSSDTYVNVKKQLDVNQKSASTTGLGVKYTLNNSLNKLWGVTLPVDVAAVLGYEYSAVDFGSTVDRMGQTTLGLGGVVSKKIDMYIPYGAIALKSLSQNAMPGVDARPGTGIAFNIGCMIGVADNQAVAIEYNTETQSWADNAKAGGLIAPGVSLDKDNAYVQSVSGISLGYVYVF
jgi:hypothetical protein